MQFTGRRRARGGARYRWRHGPYDDAGVAFVRALAHALNPDVAAQCVRITIVRCGRTKPTKRRR